MIVIAYVMTPVVVMVCLTISIGIGGFAWSGFNANMLDIAPQVHFSLFTRRFLTFLHYSDEESQHYLVR